jgi:hypothetical protein
MDAYENHCDLVGDLQLVLAVPVLGKEGCGRDKSTDGIYSFCVLC